MAEESFGFAQGRFDVLDYVYEIAKVWKAKMGITRPFRLDKEYLAGIADGVDQILELASSAEMAKDDATMRSLDEV